MRLQLVFNGKPVSSHAPARGATCSNGKAMHGRPFQATRPHGARLPPSAAVSTYTAFQATRPHGARLELSSPVRQRIVFQATRPHGARHSQLRFRSRRIPVSSHAPARGATSPSSGRSGQRVCFKPRARTGRDLPWLPARCRLRPFQATRPHGARLSAWAGRPRRVLVSSHAPARGATIVRCRGLRFRDVSSHAPARGATARDPADAGIAGFQATRPHGARPDIHCIQIFLACFKPRARTGRDVRYECL